MRGLHSFRDIADQRESDFYQREGFYCYILHGSWDIALRDAIQNSWNAIDVYSGEALQLITFDIKGALTVKEAYLDECMNKFLNRSKLRLDQIPCLLFVRGPDLSDYFIYELDTCGNQDKQQELLVKQLRSIFSECRMLCDTRDANSIASGRNWFQENFETLHQTLRANQNKKRIGKVFEGPAGKVLFATFQTLIAAALG